jgi:hypothetical protein
MVGGEIPGAPGAGGEACVAGGLVPVAVSTLAGGVAPGGGVALNGGAGEAGLAVVALEAGALVPSAHWPAADHPQPVRTFSQASRLKYPHVWLRQLPTVACHTQPAAELHGTAAE